MNRLLLLGEDEARYGEYRLEALADGRVACSLSVGSDPATPARAYKGDTRVPNEDALLVIETETRALLAVADGHRGASASHLILRRLADGVDRVPASPAALAEAVRGVGDGEGEPADDSAATLLVAVLRRDIGGGFGWCFGDSACTLVGETHAGRFLSRPNGAYVSPGVPASLRAEHASFFDFDAPPGGLLLAFTDGVHGCHYGHPESSLGASHLQAAFAESGARPDAYARHVTEWALRGLEGHPGGQDNIALIAVAT